MGTLIICNTLPPRSEKDIFQMLSRRFYSFHQTNAGSDGCWQTFLKHKNINSMVVKFDNETNVTFPKINCIPHFVDTLPKLAIGITIFNKAKERKVPRTNRPIISLHKLLAVRSVLEGTIRRGIPGLSAALNLDNIFLLFSKMDIPQNSQSSLMQDSNSNQSLASMNEFMGCKSEVQKLLEEIYTDGYPPQQNPKNQLQLPQQDYRAQVFLPKHTLKKLIVERFLKICSTRKKIISEAWQNCSYQLQLPQGYFKNEKFRNLWSQGIQMQDFRLSSTQSEEQLQNFLKSKCKDRYEYDIFSWLVYINFCILLKQNQKFVSIWQEGQVWANEKRYFGQINYVSDVEKQLKKDQKLIFHEQNGDEISKIYWTQMYDLFKSFIKKEYLLLDYLNLLAIYCLIPTGLKLKSSQLKVAQNQPQILMCLKGFSIVKKSLQHFGQKFVNDKDSLFFKFTTTIQKLHQVLSQKDNDYAENQFDELLGNSEIKEVITQQDTQKYSGTLLQCQDFFEYIYKLDQNTVNQNSDQFWISSISSISKKKLKIIAKKVLRHKGSDFSRQLADTFSKQNRWINLSHSRLPIKDMTSYFREFIDQGAHKQLSSLQNLWGNLEKLKGIDLFLVIFWSVYFKFSSLAKKNRQISSTIQNPTKYLKKQQLKNIQKFIDRKDLLQLGEYLDSQKPVIDAIQVYTTGQREKDLQAEENYLNGYTIYSLTPVTHNYIQQSNFSEIKVKIQGFFGFLSTLNNAKEKDKYIYMIAFGLLMKKILDAAPKNNPYQIQEWGKFYKAARTISQLLYLRDVEMRHFNNVTGRSRMFTGMWVSSSEIQNISEVQDEMREFYQFWDKF